LQASKFLLIFLSLLDQFLNLINVKKVEEFENAYLAVLYLSEHWERENANKGNHSNRYKADKVDE